MIPQKFSDRMKSLLGEEYPDFAKALEGCEVKGLRVNTIKCTAEEIKNEAPFKLTALDYCEEGFILENPDGIGNTPEHHAGKIYIQDPGAMSALSALDIKRGMWVLDLCSAPGGKSSQAAAKIGDEGFILSNEFVPKRAKIVVSNFERLGIKNAMVTSLDTSEFKKHFNAAFDLVIVDAPCSGEGMFRKANDAITEWSEENVDASAKRQAQILENAYSLVKPGGYLLYSTCTYSLEENEKIIDAFLSHHPDYKLEKVKDELIKASSDGICFEGAMSCELYKTRRFYPHKSRGEGQFAALMKRSSLINERTVLPSKSHLAKPSAEEARLIDEFFIENLTKKPEGEVKKHGENLVLISHACPVLPKSVFSAGVLLGEVRRGFFHPSHQFFSAYGELFKRQEHLKRDDERLRKYLLGEEIEAIEAKGNGYLTVFFGKSALGGGKAVDGRIKNHYPKGLRLLK